MQIENVKDISGLRAGLWLEQDEDMDLVERNLGTIYGVTET